MTATRFAVANSTTDTFAVYKTRERAEALVAELAVHFPLPVSVPGYAIAEVPSDTPLRLFPPKAIQLLRAATSARHGRRLTSRLDALGRPLLTIATTVDADRNTVRAMWPTRGNGTYRLFSCLVGRECAPRRGSVDEAIRQLRDSGRRTPSWGRS